MAATNSGVASRTNPHSPTDSAELVTILESNTETITGAVSAGELTLDELDRFVRNVDHGKIDGQQGVDTVVRIVRSLLDDDAPSWEEMEPAGQAVGT